MNAITSAVRVEQIGNATLYLGDCREVLPGLGQFGAVLTDPPYGIDRAKGHGEGGGMGALNGGYRPRTGSARKYVGSWDKERPTSDTLNMTLSHGLSGVVWGGQYFAHMLPAASKWLFWDKMQTMPSYSDGELAWTSLPGTSLKKFTYNGSGLMAKEKGRVHPTQKPVQLMEWCLGLIPDALTVLDPFMGSGTTGVACAKLGRSFVGIEIDPGYFDVACKRIAAAQCQADFFITPSREDASFMRTADLFTDGKSK